MASLRRSTSTSGCENSSEEERERTVRAIARGLDDMNAGRARRFEEFDREFRERHGLPPRA
jgi:hypothetical protein